MSMLISAPYPAVETTTVLPNPDFSDVENHRNKLKVRRSIDNTKRTYIQKPSRQALTYRFKLVREKALELKAFIQAYYLVEMVIKNHKDEQWRVWLTNNPFEFTSAGASRSVYGRSYETIELQFDGYKL